jgi:5-methylthioadenosine/S-adenosylhomocysteine deaminase
MTVMELTMLDNLSRARIDLLLVGGAVVTMDADWTVVLDGAVAVSAGAIVAVGPAPALAEAYDATEVRDCRGCAVLPGLVNGHTHVPMSLFRGLGADRALQSWLVDFIFPLEARFVRPDFVRAGARLSCAELIRAGVTTFVDMYYFEDEVARAADEAGLRAICGQALADLPVPDAPTVAAGLARAERLLADWAGHPRVTPAVAPHATYTCSADTFRAAAALCRAHGVPLVTHLAETAREVATSQASCGLTPVAWLEATGALAVPCVAAHCVHVSDGDLEILRARGAGAVPCPTSNLKLASGVAPFARLLAAGLRVGLGTDGPASNDDQDLLAEVHLAALLAKGTSGDATALPAREALALATCRGAAAAHLADQVGSLVPGKRADVAVIALDGLHLAPEAAQSPDVLYSRLVYAARAADVRDVLVDGRWLLRDGDHCTLDVPAVRAEAETHARAVARHLAGA